MTSSETNNIFSRSNSLRLTGKAIEHLRRFGIAYEEDEVTQSRKKIS